MRRLRHSLGLVLLVLLAAAPASASAATRYISPSGSDSAACTQAAPCASFTRAYNVAAAGDTVEVGAGVYQPQEVPTGTKAITFHGVAGNKVRKLDNHSDNVTFDGIDVDAGGLKPAGAAFEDHGNQYVTFKNGRIGNVVDEKGALLGGQTSPASLHLVIDNVVFHDVIQQGAEVHNECLFTQSAGLILRNSTFTNCATMDASINRGSWWGQEPYGGVTLENNVFGHSVNGSGWHYYGVMFSTGAFTNNRVVNNTFENAVYFANIGTAPYSGVWANNIGGGWDCLSGVTFRFNAGQKCDASDKQISPQNSCNPPACNPGYTMPIGWVNPAANDFHLKSTSAAINAGTAAYAPARDRDGNLRDTVPDAGAYEYNGAAPPPSDRDGDGVPDSSDACPDTYGSGANGCPPPPAAAQCGDGLDNDGDGKVDTADPGCSSAGDDSESPDPAPAPSAQCSDGADNDGDGKIDLADPGCSSGTDDSESPDPAPAPAGTRYVTPTGSDTAACSSAAPCKTLARAYNAAVAGDVISIAAGSYPAQTVPSGSKAVTFRAAAGSKIARLANSAANVTFDGLDLDAGGTSGGDTAVFENNGVDGVTFKNGRIGNIVDQKGALVSGTNFTFDNVVFHDAVLRTPGVHLECLFAIGVEGMKVRNSTFHNCAIMDLYFEYGYWWTPQPPAYNHVTIENNVFEHVMNEDDSWNYYPLYIGRTGSDTLDGWVVRHNTFEQNATAASTHTSAVNSIWANNVGGWDCVPGMVYKGNVGKRCAGSSDKAVSPDQDTRTTIAPFGWADPRNGDFHLTAGSPAVGAADPSQAIARDRDGKLRDSAPDAGAYELVGATPPPPPADRDGDGVPDSGDACPDVAGTGANGCPPPPPAAQCADGKDNDGDAKVDLADPGCSSASDDSESPDPVIDPVPVPVPDPTPLPLPTIPNAGALVGAWSFNETSGTWANDSSGKGNDGAIMGPVRTDKGKYGRALAFDGKNDYVKVADAPSLDLSAGMTLEAWVYPKATSSSRTVLFKENLARKHEAYALYAGNGTGRPTAEVAVGPGYTTLDGSDLLAANTWTHIAATYDGTTLRVYRNGVLVGSKPLTGGLVTTGDPLKLGGNAVWGEWFNGTIDEVRVFSGARSVTEIQADMKTPVLAPGTAAATKVGGSGGTSARHKAPRSCARAAKLRAKRGKHSKAAKRAARTCRKAKARLRRAH